MPFEKVEEVDMVLRDAEKFWEEDLWRRRWLWRISGREMMGSELF